jgi:hypothetical protein
MIDIKVTKRTGLTTFSISGESESVADMSIDILDSGEAWAIVGWKGKGKYSVWEYMIPDSESVLLHLVKTRSMGKTAHHIKRVAEVARAAGGQS